MMAERAPAAIRLFVGKDVHKFSCAHMTVFPDGTKERLHGHNFQASIELELVGTDPELLDFALLKKALQAQCDAWTERLLLPGQSPALVVVRESDGELEFRLCGQRYVVPAGDVIVLPVRNVVVESLARVFAHALIARLGPALTPELVAALSVTIAESVGQGATFRVELSGGG